MNSSGLHLVEIEVTNRCNLSCKHCYVDRKELIDMPKETIFSLIDELNKMKVYRLVLTGGEPLLREDLFEIAEYAKNTNITQIVLMTNGLLINSHNLESLKTFDLVQLSIDVPPGVDPHFRINYLNALEKRIDMLISVGVKVHLQATLHRSLLPYLKQLFKFAEEKDITLGLNRLMLTGDATNLESERLSPHELKKSLEIIYEAQKSNPLIKCSDPLFFLVNPERMKRFVMSNKQGIIGGCIAGIAALYIKSNGDVLPCPFINYVIANIYNDNSLEKIWFDNEVLNQLRNRDSYHGKCGSCKFRYFCGGCRANSLITTGDLFGSDPDCWLNE